MTLAQIRAQFTRRAFRALRRVQVEHAGICADVDLELREDLAARGGWRRWLICPNCGAAVTLLGLVGDRWKCRACGKWRSRNRIVSTPQVPKDEYVLGTTDARNGPISTQPTDPPPYGVVSIDQNVPG